MAVLPINPLSLGHAAQFILSLVVSFSLLNISRKSPAAWLLGTAFILNACAALLLCIAQFIPAWQSHIVTIYSIWFLAVLIPLLQFGYVFPNAFQTSSPESRRVLSVSIGFFMVGLIAALLSMSGLYPAYPSEDVLIAKIFGGVELAWLVSLFVRQGMISSTNAFSGVIGLFINRTREAQASRLFILLVCLALLVATMPGWFPNSGEIWPISIVQALGVLWISAALALLFLSYAVEQTALIQKFSILFLSLNLSMVVACSYFIDLTFPFVLVITICVLFCQAVFVLFFHRLINRPLYRLTRSIDQINAGDWQTEIESSTNDEITYISQSFTNIIRTVEIAAKALRQANISLQQKLDEQRGLISELHLANQRLQNVSRHFAETQEKERRRLAGELHDEVGQALTGIKLTLEMSRKLPQDTTRLLNEAQDLLMDLIHRVNDLSLNLRPVMLDEFGLLPALLYFFDNYTRQTSVEVFFQQNDLEDKRFTPELETAVYRIIQEALTNCARYAKVEEVSVRILMNNETMLVEVEDHGVGFDSAANSEAGYTYGIAGMMERAALIGGKLDVESSLGSGTFVCAHLPIQTMDEDRHFDMEKEYNE